ncbi:OLC1v1018889C1 [Oldenlandia corymbosa var. corymbosa]|uniref:OLC1v1018889C1 n=1 Tax=Oldenlandia corymbosa var. corymbosa TaxID=529605 RepID=A0AAV1ECS0_OLDCO|nr:OLC1v1018889C1 [Oldenlandia corymbosa var. corymbosa]
MVSISKVLPEATLIYYAMSNLGDPEEVPEFRGSSGKVVLGVEFSDDENLDPLESKVIAPWKAKAVLRSGSLSEDTEERGTEGSSERLKMVDAIPDVEILSSTEVLSPKPLAFESVLKENKEREPPVVVVLAKEVYEDPVALLGNPMVSSGVSARGIETFRPGFQRVHSGSILNSSHLWQDWFANIFPPAHKDYLLTILDEDVAQRATFASLETSLEKRLVELGDTSAQTQEENKNLIKELEALQDRHLLITEGILYFFSEGLSNSVFQRQFKRLSYYQKAIGEHKMALHYHSTFEGVKLEEMPGYNPNVVAKAQEAKGALHHLALGYHKVLANNAQNPTPILMGIHAKRLMPNPEASTSRTVAAHEASGTRDGEGEVNQRQV